MKNRNSIIIYTALFSLVFYLIDSFVYFILFSAGDQTFLQVLISDVPSGHLFGRLLGVTAIIIFGITVYGIMNNLYLENDFLRNQVSSISTGKLDTSFISSLSYQIRTPLNAIVGFSELLKEPNLTAKSKHTYINHINSSGNYLLQLINNIVDIAKIESGQININNVEFDLNELLDDLLDYFNERKHELGKSTLGLSLMKGVKKKSFHIITDKERLRQVFSNILENAIKHTDEGNVEFGYNEKEAAMLEFYVRDTGRGFSMERLDMIFNRYKKLSDNHDQPFDGFALRLTISKSLLKLLGGDIRADSKPGEGSVFYFTINYKISARDQDEEKHLSASKVSRVKPAENNWKEYTILIAEDVESNYIYLQELLKPTQVELIWAKDGKQAVENINSNRKIDLVLMDILMPEMDGYEAARQIKALRKDLPIIAQTAYSIDNERNKEDLINFDDYLIKPIWSPQLIGMVSKYLKMFSR